MIWTQLNIDKFVISILQKIFLIVSKQFQVNTDKIKFIPISIKNTENIKTKKYNMDWYKGSTLIEALDQIQLDDQELLSKQPLRMIFHDCIRIPGIGTIALGKLLYGNLKQNETLRFASVPYTSCVKAIEHHHFQFDIATPGYLIGLNLANLSYKEISNGFLCSNNKIDPVRECISFIAQLKILTYFKHKFKIKQCYTTFFYQKNAIQNRLNLLKSYFKKLNY